MEEWLNSYYAELDPVKRQQILEENSRDTQSGDGLLRHSSGQPDMARESRKAMPLSDI